MRIKINKHLTLTLVLVFIALVNTRSTNMIAGESNTIFQQTVIINGISYTNHSELEIVSDSQLAEFATNEGWSGTGTENNPYIIENYLFQYTSHALTLKYTTKFLVFRNNIVQGKEDNTSLCALVLDTVTNAKFIDNQITFAHDSFYIAKSSNLTLQENSIDVSRGYGINLFMCDHIKLENNSITNTKLDGIRLYYSTDNNVTENVVKNGDLSGIVVLKSSNNNALKFNTINDNKQYGIEIDSDSSGNVITDNTLNGNKEGSIKNEGSNNVIQGAKSTPTSGIVILLFTIVLISLRKKQRVY
ncbi:MAG: right-handed parallel beta-helix repeat-containing protein [Candidatus Hodarchaeales archaeon]